MKARRNEKNQAKKSKRNGGGVKWRHHLKAMKHRRQWHGGVINEAANQWRHLAAAAYQYKHGVGIA